MECHFRKEVRLNADKRFHEIRRTETPAENESGNARYDLSQEPVRMRVCPVAILSVPLRS